MCLLWVFCVFSRVFYECSTGVPGFLWVFLFVLLGCSMCFLGFSIGFLRFGIFWG